MILWFMTDLYCKMATYGSQKRGQATKEGFRNIAQTCRGGVKKAKAQLELARPSRARQRASASAWAKKGQTRRCGLTAKQGSWFHGCKHGNLRIASISWILKTNLNPLNLNNIQRWRYPLGLDSCMFTCWHTAHMFLAHDSCLTNLNS